MIKNIFMNVIEISVFSSFFILLFILISKKIRNTYTNRIMYIVWLFMAIRIICNFNIPQPLINITIPNQAITITENVTNYGMYEYSTRYVPTEINIENNTQNMSVPETKEPLLEKSDKLDKILSATPYIWLLGVIISLLIYTLSHISFIKMLKRWRKPISDANILDIYINICSEMNIHKRPKIFLCNMISSPICTGIFKKEIYINSEDLSGINLILKHELTHCKRNDILYKLILIIAKSIHFFNPIIHIMVKEAEKCIELYCDETVMKNCSLNERKEYSIAILNAIKSSSKNSILTTSFSSDKKSLKIRFSNILDTKIKKRGILIMIMLSLMAISGGIFVSCNKNTEAQNVTQQEYIKNIYELRTPYIGNASAVGKIFSNLNYTNLQQQEMELFTTEEPFGVLKHFSTDNIENVDEKEIMKNSVLLLSLIDNCGYIKSHIYAPDGSEVTYSLTRDDYLLQYGNFKEIYDSPENFENFIKNIWENIDNDHYIIEKQNEKSSSVALVEGIIEDKKDRTKEDFKYHENYTQLLNMGEKAYWDFIEYFQSTDTDGDKEYIMMKFCRENYPNLSDFGKIGNLAQNEYTSGRKWFNDYQNLVNKYNDLLYYNYSNIIDEKIQKIYTEKYKDLYNGYTITSPMVTFYPEKIDENKEIMYAGIFAGYFVLENKTFKAVDFDKILYCITFDTTDVENPIIISCDDNISESEKTNSLYDKFSDADYSSFKFKVHQFMEENNINANTIEFDGQTYINY